MAERAPSETLEPSGVNNSPLTSTDERHPNSALHSSILSSPHVSLIRVLLTRCSDQGDTKTESVLSALRTEAPLYLETSRAPGLRALISQAADDGLPVRWKKLGRRTRVVQLLLSAEERTSLCKQLQSTENSLCKATTSATPAGESAVPSRPSTAEEQTASLRLVSMPHSLVERRR